MKSTPYVDERETLGGIAFFGTIVLLSRLITYSMWVAMGVVEEKSSRSSISELSLAETVSVGHSLS